MDFFYDKQIRRFITQFVRIFSDFYVEYGKDANGNSVMYRVPCRYADTNRQVAAIMKQNSENVMSNVPAMVVYMTDIKYDRDRIQEPHFVDNKVIRQRQIDPLTGQYNSNQGQTYSLERIMPVPYRITMRMEMWTSNMDQKLQLWEQIVPLFNPDMEIQNTDNWLDWSSLSYILLTDQTWTSRPIPVGTDEVIDVATLTFEMPIWITTPAKLKRLGVIQNIVASIYDASGTKNINDVIFEELELLGKRQYFTLTGYQVIVDGGNIKLLPRGGPEINNTNLAIPTTNAEQIAWKPVVESFGKIKDNYSMMYLQDANSDRLISGTIAYDPNDEYNLLFNVDTATLPTNTLQSVNAIVDPTVNGPGYGLPAAATSQRYLILKNIGSTENGNGNGPRLWQNTNGSSIVAHTNDIIQYDGHNWTVAFHPDSNNPNQYVTNTYTGIQYVWTGIQWQKSWLGLYQEGLWSIVI
jgi:hypothetical protein